MATNSETSTTNPEPSDTLGTFATFRVSGDRLDPERISEILGARPTIAYRKGERYYAGPRSGYLLGRTGVWYLSTKDLVPGRGPIEHLGYLVRLLAGPAGDQPDIRELQQLMSCDGLKADASLFWHGGKGADEPVIPTAFTRVFEAIPADLERDFDRD